MPRPPQLRDLLLETLTTEMQPEGHVVRFVQKFRNDPPGDVGAALRQLKRDGLAASTTPYGGKEKYWARVTRRAA